MANGVDHAEDTDLSWLYCEEELPDLGIEDDTFERLFQLVLRKEQGPKKPSLSLSTAHDLIPKSAQTKNLAKLKDGSEHDPKQIGNSINEVNADGLDGKDNEVPANQSKDGRPVTETTKSSENADVQMTSVGETSGKQTEEKKSSVLNAKINLPDDPLKLARLDRPVGEAVDMDVEKRSRIEEELEFSDESSDEEFAVGLPKQNMDGIDQDLIRATGNLAYSWESLQLGKVLGTPAYNKYQRNLLLTEPNVQEVTQLTAPQMVELVHSMRVQHLPPPPGSFLYETKSDRKRKSDQEQEPQVVTMMRRLYRRMTRQEADDFDVFRRDMELTPASDVMDQMAWLSKRVRELQERESRLLGSEDLQWTQSDKIQSEARFLFGS